MTSDDRAGPNRTSSYAWVFGLACAIAIFAVAPWLLAGVFIVAPMAIWSFPQMPALSSALLAWIAAGIAGLVGLIGSWSHSSSSRDGALKTSLLLLCCGLAAAVAAVGYLVTTLNAGLIGTGSNAVIVAYIAAFTILICAGLRSMRRLGRILSSRTAVTRDLLPTIFLAMSLLQLASVIVNAIAL